MKIELKRKWYGDFITSHNHSNAHYYSNVIWLPIKLRLPWFLFPLGLTNSSCYASLNYNTCLPYRTSTPNHLYLPQGLSPGAGFYCGPMWKLCYLVPPQCLFPLFSPTPPIIDHLHTFKAIDDPPGEHAHPTPNVIISPSLGITLTIIISAPLHKPPHENHLMECKGS